MLPLEARSVEHSVRDEGQEQQLEKMVEPFPVLEGLRKYALGNQRKHMLLAGQLELGKSTTLRQFAVTLTGEEEEEEEEQVPVLKHVLLAGRPGSGKSTTLRQFAVTLAEEGQVPVLVQLKGDRPVPELIQAEFRRMKQRVTLEQIDEWLLAERLVLLLDGVNEIPNDELRRSLAQFREDNLTVPMIFTTRDLSLGGSLGIGKRLEMKPLSELQMREFVGKYLPEYGDRLLGQLRDRLRELAETPLLLKLLCDVFDPKINQIPQNKGELFRWFDRDYKRIKREIEYVPVSENFWEFKSEVLQYLAFSMIQGDVQTADLQKPPEPWLTITKSQAEGILETWLHRRGISNAPTKAKLWLKDLCNHHFLQDAAKPEEIEFHHQLFQEYYAAEYLLQLLKLPDGKLGLSNEELKRDYLNYLKWTESFALMLALVEKQALALQVVKLAVDDVDLMLGAKLAGGVKSEFQEATIASVIEAIKRQQVSPTYEIELLGNTHSKYAVPILLEKLTDQENQDFILTSAFALKELGHQSAVQKLLPLLEDNNELTSIATLFVLGALGNEAIVPNLQQALKQSNNYIRSAVIEALGELGNCIVIPDLQQALQDPSNEIREKAIKSLGKIRDNLVLPELIKIAVEDPNISLRWTAAKVLGQIDREKATEELLKVLKGEDNYKIRQNVAEALGEIGSETAVDGLIASLESPHADWSVAEALVEIGSRKAVPGLIQALKHSVPCEQAAFALGELGDARAVPALIGALNHWASQTRERAVKALGKIGDVKVVPKLYKLYEALQDSPKNELKREIVITLGKLGDDRIRQELLEILKEIAFGVVYYSNWVQVFEAIEKIGDQAAVQVLVQVLLESKIPKYRWKAAEVLGNLGNEAAIDGLLAAATDHNSTVRWKSAEALGKLNNLQVMPRILPLLKPEKDPNIRQVAVQVLGYLADEAAVTALLEALNDLEPDVRYDAAQSLVRLSSSFKDKSASTALMEASKALGYPWKNKLLNDGFIYQVQVIKENCKFYNYEIWQEAEINQNEKLKKQKGKQGATVGQATEGLHVTYEVNAEVFQVIEHNDGDVIGNQSVDRQSTGD
ncbi:HEAT repeat domain-containing protein [Pantanalinema sp. GBBB05]|uniref:HEAT repeat domain-containing protein n=1 Tax=Pantanalinema sp. GBBB05 TaxID=2604139 RepID=UPI003D814811